MKVVKLPVCPFCMSEMRMNLNSYDYHYWECDCGKWTEENDIVGQYDKIIEDRNRKIEEKKKRFRQALKELENGDF